LPPPLLVRPLIVRYTQNGRKPSVTPSLKQLQQIIAREVNKQIASDESLEDSLHSWCASLMGLAPVLSTPH
jgi:hypothetical protein